MTRQIHSMEVDGSNFQSFTRTGSEFGIIQTGVTDPSGVMAGGSETVVYVSQGAADFPAPKDAFLYVFQGGVWTAHDRNQFELRRLGTVPGSPGTVYAYGFDLGVAVASILKSTDFGASFSDIGLPAFDDNLSMIYGWTDGYCYVACSGTTAALSGVFRSNGGAWEQIIQGLDDGGGAFGSPANFIISDDTVWWIDSDNDNAYRFAGGVQTLLDNPGVAMGAIQHGSNGTTMLMANNGGGNPGEIYRSTDLGASWTLSQSEDGMTGSGASGQRRFGQDPRVPSRWWYMSEVDTSFNPTAAQIRVWLSTDDGLTWTDQPIAGQAVDAAPQYRASFDIWVAA